MHAVLAGKCIGPGQIQKRELLLVNLFCTRKLNSSLKFDEEPVRRCLEARKMTMVPVQCKVARALASSN